MIAALNSTAEDCWIDNGRVLVTGKNIEGEVIFLGEFNESVLYMEGTNPAALIEHIRFGR